MATIDDLLEALQNPNKVELPNTAETWRRIGEKDNFEELGLDKSELDIFLKEFVDENPYENI